MFLVDPFSSVIQYVTQFKDEWGVSYLDARNIDTPQDMKVSRFMDGKKLNVVFSHAHVGKLFLEYLAR